MLMSQHPNLYFSPSFTRISGVATVTFDTLEGVRRLREVGFDEKQAEAVVRVLADAQEHLVTPEHFDAKFEKLQWMIGILIALAIANFTKQFF